MQPIPTSSLEPVGHDLHRPECVLPFDEHVLVSDWRGGVTEIRADGAQQTWLGHSSHPPLRPNGIGLTSRETFVIAHLGESGGVFELSRDGTVHPLLLEIDGVALPPTNFATYDTSDRLWISVSTRHNPRQAAWRSNVWDGFVAVLDRRGARIVADGIHYTNEVGPIRQDVTCT